LQASTQNPNLPEPIHAADRAGSGRVDDAVDDWRLPLTSVSGKTPALSGHPPRRTAGGRVRPPSGWSGWPLYVRVSGLRRCPHQLSGTSHRGVDRPNAADPIASDQWAYAPLRSAPFRFGSPGRSRSLIQRSHRSGSPRIRLDRQGSAASHAIQISSCQPTASAFALAGNAGWRTPPVVISP
jgi:hypothetical protein